MSDIQRLRQKSLMDSYDQLTPGAGGGGYAPPQYQDEQAVLPSTNIYGAPPSGLGQIAQQQQQTIAPPRVDPNASLQRTVDAINRVYTPETTSRDRFNDLLDNTPVREAPGVGRSLFAGLMSLKADDPIKTAETVMYAPHMRNMQDWTARTGPFKDAAQLENTANINERTLAGNVVNAQTQADRIAETGRIADQKAANDKIRAQAYALKQNGYQIKVEGDRVVATNPNTLERHDLGPSGSMDEYDKISLQNQGRVEAARVGAGAAMDRTVAAGADYYRGPDGTIYGGNPRGNGPPPPPGSTNIGNAPSSKPKTVLETQRERNERLREAYEVMPGAGKWIVQAGSGRFDMKPRPKPSDGLWPFTSGNSKEVEEWDNLKKIVDPDYVVPASTKPESNQGLGPTATPGRTASAPPPAGNGTKPGKAGDYTEVDIRGQQDQELANGTRVKAYDRNGKVVGTVPNTPEGYKEATDMGLRIKVGP